jgi:hypothetical protein
MCAALVQLLPARAPPLELQAPGMTKTQRAAFLGGRGAPKQQATSPRDANEKDGGGGSLRISNLYREVRRARGYPERGTCTRLTCYILLKTPD